MLHSVIMVPPRSTLAVLLIGCLVVLGAAFSVAAADYALDASNAIETEPRTVSVEGESHEVSAVSVVSAGTTLSVDVTVPDDERFGVDLYTSERQVEDFERGEGSERVTFDTDDLEPGSYVLRLRVDGTGKAVHPVVIEGYEIDTISHPGEVTEDEDVAIEAAVTKTGDGDDIDGLELIVWNGDVTERIPADRVDDGRYEATLQAGTLAPGTYDVYAVVQGPDEVHGNPEPLGMNAGPSLTVTDPAATDPTPTETPPDDGTATPTDTPENESTPENETATPTDTASPTPTPTPTETSTPTVTPTPTETLTPTPTETSTGSVVTPAIPTDGTDGDDDTPTEADSAQPAALLAFLAIAIVVAYALVRSTE